MCVNSMAQYRMSPNSTSWRQVWVLDSERRGQQNTGHGLLQIPSKMQMMLLFEHLVGMSTVCAVQVQFKRHGTMLDVGAGLLTWDMVSSY